MMYLQTYQQMSVCWMGLWIEFQWEKLLFLSSAFYHCRYSKFMASLFFMFMLISNWFWTPQAPFTSSLSTASMGIWSTICIRIGTASWATIQRSQRKSWTFLDWTRLTKAREGRCRDRRCCESLSYACVRAQSLQSCPTLVDPMDCSPLGSSVRGIFQAKILECVAISSSKEEMSYEPHQWRQPMSWWRACLQIQGQEVARLKVNYPASSPCDMLLRDTPCL